MQKRENFKKSIYVLPNLFTSMNIFCGFYAVLSAVDGRFTDAAVAIIIGAVFDLLDGKIARATNTSSQFGVEYDSLADLITFGLAPALVMYLWALKPLGRLGWLAGFLFMACGALRLARFNTAAASGSSSSYFQGLPIPAAAGMNVSVVLFFSRINIDPASSKVFILLMLYLLSFLMVSSIKYYSFKKTGLFKSMKFNKLVAIVLMLVLIAYEPGVALFVGMLIYVCSGPVYSLFLMSHSTRSVIDDDEHEDEADMPDEAEENLLI
ncbi:CDP-diacylglycerol--serine O-phosphatidyltransferase [Desulfamplus magnetovallimortis]|uniref:CDP-diacylglycerol--serine O-phosphatidyltransferase n=1 Tax=Desulfamplus magnetovallimortis TaxID=1246637 RepID=A0A1W1HKH7_9BACT|nr:CDP-diacylglycerol--serine O-phosphatidyltransferase [Desulfamplus magnetovallimortis]SLM32960.1 CDP-diacylglycerol--serine O-phosphatidyltransferase [Desulfamplus magnetovallimortis]